MPGNVEYVLFDMDGLLIDTEEIYSVATNEVLQKYGKEMTWDIKAGCMGKPERQSAEYLLGFFPDISLDVDTFLVERNRVQDTLWPTTRILPGAETLVQHLKKHNIPIAVATSSRRRNFNLKTAHLQDFIGLFDGKILCADDAEHKLNGKPAPDIFLRAAKIFFNRDVGLPDDTPTAAQVEERNKGLVFEDSVPGMQAGKRAGMQVIWVPDPRLLELDHSVDEKADGILHSLEEFQPGQWSLPPYDSA